MDVSVINAQRAVPVRVARLTRLARCVVRALRIRAAGRLEITLVDAKTLRNVNARFLRHDWTTDVLTFRYDGAAGASRRLPRAVVGEVLIAPSHARAYARRHGLSASHELDRYVVHGVLSWVARTPRTARTAGGRDRTGRRPLRMRREEARLLARCRAAWRGPARP